MLYYATGQYYKNIQWSKSIFFYKVLGKLSFEINQSVNMHLCTLHVWLKRPSVPRCWVRQHWRRHQGVGLQGVVGKQERGVHYKRRLNPEERPNIHGKWRRGGWDQGESRGDQRGAAGGGADKRLCGAAPPRWWRLNSRGSYSQTHHEAASE